eukprot:COSAG02_NODE_64024_length_261_cov_1.271605_1_plen_49_part_10
MLPRRTHYNVIHGCYALPIFAIQRCASGQSMLQDHYNPQHQHKHQQPDS